MKFYKDEVLLLDTNLWGLNFGLISFDGYKSSFEKLVKTDSDNFDDMYVYNTGSYNGFGAVLEVVVRSFKLKDFEKVLRKSNRFVLDKEPSYYRQFIVDGAVEYDYSSKEFCKLRIPLYVFAFRYSLFSETFRTSNFIENIINNKGSFTADVVYKIFGNGEVIFNVNGVRNVLKNCNGAYVVDARKFNQGVYALDGKAKNITSEYDGAFPLLSPGDNSVQLIKGSELVIDWRVREI